MEIEQSVAAEEQTNTTKIFEPGEKLPRFDTSNFVKKDYFLEKKTIVIQRVQLSQFKSPEIVFLDEKGNELRVDTPTKVYMELLKRFGDDVEDWKDQKVTLKSDVREYNINGQQKQGYHLHLV